MSDISSIVYMIMHAETPVDAEVILIEWLSKHDSKTRIETAQIIDSTLRFEGIPLSMLQSESLKVYIRQLEAINDKTT